MADRQEFVDEFVASVKAKDWRLAAMQMTEEFTMIDPKEMKSVIAHVNKALREESRWLPLVHFKVDKNGDPNFVDLDNGLVWDSPMYIRPEASGRRLADPEQERLATHFAAVNELADSRSDYGVIVRREHVKQAGEFVLNETLKLNKKDICAVLKRASQLTAGKNNCLDVLFTDLDGDGNRNELSDVTVSSFYSNYRGLTAVDKIDLYDPPVSRK